jgi:hypothetical protein
MPQKRSQAAPQPTLDGVCPAVVIGLDDDPTRVAVRLAKGGPAGVARLALASPYRPAEGDRVLVAAGEGELYVIGVLHAAHPPSLAIPGGGAVSVREGAVEIADAAGRVVVRWSEGSAEIAAPAGDLTLSAPAGNVVIRGGREVEIAGGPEVVTPQIRVGAVETRLTSTRLEVKAEESRLVTTQATVVAARIATTASTLVQAVERFELTATRLIEKTRDAFRDAEGLAQTRVGRARTIVKDAFSLHSRTTSLASTEDTSIDGNKILLG